MTKPNPSALQAVKNVDQDRFISSTGIIDLNLRTKDVAPRSMDAETRDSIHDAVDMVLACVPAEVEALGKLIYAIDDWSLVDRKDMKQLGIRWAIQMRRFGVIALNS